MAVRRPLFWLHVNDTSRAVCFGRKLRRAFHEKKSLPEDRKSKHARLPAISISLECGAARGLADQMSDQGDFIRKNIVEDDQRLQRITACPLRGFRGASSGWSPSGFDRPPAPACPPASRRPDGQPGSIESRGPPAPEK